MIITEPTTMLTDYAIAGAAFILAGFLFRAGWRNQQTSVSLWAAAFLFVAVAAALGGTCHGFVVELGSALNGVLWRIMIYAISLASFSMLVGTIVSSVSQRMRGWFFIGAVTKLVLTWINLMRLPRFGIAAIDYLTAMIIVLALQLCVLAGSPQLSANRAASWLIAGILVSGLAIGVLASGFTLSKSFNHNDLYHLIQLAGLGLLYQGAKQLKDR